MDGLLHGAGEGSVMLTPLWSRLVTALWEARRIAALWAKGLRLRQLGGLRLHMIASAANIGKLCEMDRRSIRPKDSAADAPPFVGVEHSVSTSRRIRGSAIERARHFASTSAMSSTRSFLSMYSAASPRLQKELFIVRDNYHDRRFKRTWHCG